MKLEPYKNMSMDVLSPEICMNSGSYVAGTNASGHVEEEVVKNTSRRIDGVHSTSCCYS